MDEDDMGTIVPHSAETPAETIAVGWNFAGSRRQRRIETSMSDPAAFRLSLVGE
jgi:hypothetical protein